MTDFASKWLNFEITILLLLLNFKGCSKDGKLVWYLFILEQVTIIRNRNEFIAKIYSKKLIKSADCEQIERVI